MVHEQRPAAGARRPSREQEHWHANGSGLGSRLQSWSGILAATHVAYDVRATNRTPEHFDGTVTRGTVGDLQLLDCIASPFVGNRGHGMVGAQRGAEQPEDILGFQFVFRGVELVREGRRALALTAGDIVLWDGLEPLGTWAVEGVPGHARNGRDLRVDVEPLSTRLGAEAVRTHNSSLGPCRPNGTQDVTWLSSVGAIPDC